MTFNQLKFEKYARITSPTEIGKRLGITRQAVAQRLQNLENIRLREFLDHLRTHRRGTRNLLFRRRTRQWIEKIS